MSCEWTNQFNPFNSIKALAWRERLEAFWGGAHFAPVTLNLELTNRCQQDCPWCFTAPFRKACPVDISFGHVNSEAVDWWVKWGVKGVVLCGGGEPQLHKDFPQILTTLVHSPLKLGVVTGCSWSMSRTLLPDWIGVSIDAGQESTWKNLGKHGKLETLLNSYKRFREGNSNLPLTYKFLAWVPPGDPKLGNIMDIPDAAKLAKEHGFNCIHIRPAYGTGEIRVWDELIAQAREEETETFKVYAPTHKVSLASGSSHRRFSRCLATPLLLNVCADSGLYFCQDHRGEWPYLLANLTTCGGWQRFITEVWGSTAHLERLLGVEPSSCSRCTFNAYNEVFERLPDMTPEFV